PFNDRSSDLFFGTSIIVSDHGNSLLWMYRIPDSGSAAAPPHSPPPSNPGKIHEPSLLGGVNIFSYFTFLYFSSISACASGEMLVTSSIVNFCRANGSGKVGMGCVGHVSSPGSASRGTALSSMGNTGLPVIRSKTKTYPCLVIWA